MGEAAAAGRVGTPPRAAVREGSEASRGGRERSARERQESDGRADGWAYRGVGAAPAHFLRFFCGPLARPAVPCPRLPLPLLKSNPLPEQDDGAGEGPERKKQGSWGIAAASAPRGAWSSTPPPCGLPCPAGLLLLAALGPLPLPPSPPPPTPGRSPPAAELDPNAGSKPPSSSSSSSSIAPISPHPSARRARTRRCSSLAPPPWRPGGR